MASSPLRLLMTADTVGGVWTYAVELVQALGPQRAEVLLATLGAPLSSAQSRAAARLSNLTVCESRYKLEWMDDPWADVDASGAWLMELEREFRPQIVHLNTYAHGALPWNAPVLMVGHSCVLSWWQSVKGEAAPPHWSPYQARVQAGLANADLVAAPSRTMLDALRSYYGPFRATQVIYNARWPGDFVPGVKEEQILAIGRLWDEAKNIALLDQAAVDIPWPIYVAGEQRHPSGGKLEPVHLRTLGQLSQAQVRSWLASAALYVLPARYEPFGLSVLEAALSGCALVLGDIASLRELWGGAALFVSPDDASHLAAVLRDLIDHPRRLQTLAQAARRRARRYLPATMADAYWQVYTRLIAEGAANVGLRRKRPELALPFAPSHYSPAPPSGG